MEGLLGVFERGSDLEPLLVQLAELCAIEQSGAVGLLVAEFGPACVGGMLQSRTIPMWLKRAGDR